MSGFGQTQRWDRDAAPAPEKPAVEVPAAVVETPVATTEVKAQADPVDAPVPMIAAEPAPKKRGRPPKTVVEDAPAPAPPDEEPVVDTQVVGGAPVVDAPVVSKPESITVEVTSGVKDAGPVLPAKTLAEMEEGRRTIAQYKTR